MQFIQLHLINLRRRINHHITPLIVLRECDVVADCLLTSEECAHAVETECEASVRRCSELEGVDDEAELVVRVLLAYAENLEHPLLNISLVDSD